MAPEHGHSSEASVNLCEALLAVRPLEVCVDERHGFVLVARHQMTVEVERRLDRRVTEVRRDRLRVDPGRNEEAREGVAALVESDRIEVGSAPRGQRTLPDCRGRERARAGRAEDEAIVPACDELVLNEQVSERGDDWDVTSASAALRLAGLSVARLAALDTDQTAGKVDVRPEERAEFAATQSGIELRAVRARRVRALRR